jgi:hypothetical protein
MRVQAIVDKYIISSLINHIFDLNICSAGPCQLALPRAEMSQIILVVFFCQNAILSASQERSFMAIFTPAVAAWEHF